MGMKNNEKALFAFMEKVAEAKERLDELQRYVDDHMETSPDDVNWGDVGSAGYMVEKLIELTDWAFKRGEHAAEQWEGLR
jgi:hypothetical protein